LVFKNLVSNLGYKIIVKRITQTEQEPGVFTDVFTDIAAIEMIMEATKDPAKDGSNDVTPKARLSFQTLVNEKLVIRENQMKIVYLRIYNV
jgi:hypothetical protein